MNKRKILVFVVLLSLFFIIFMVSRKNTIEEVIFETLEGLNTPYQILYKDKMGDKTIVISLVGEDGLNYTVVDNGLFAYKSIYYGYMTDLERTMDTFGVLYLELPKQVMDGNLVCFGLLNDSAISKLSIVDKSKSVDALISETTEFKYWRADVSAIKSRSIVINGTDAEGNSLLEAEEILREN